VANQMLIQCNLCAGTLAMYGVYSSIVADLLRFRVLGQFSLSEVGHGVDAINLETTATLLSDGSFLLNTPSERAAKYMPPVPSKGLPVVAIVYARLLVEGRDHGVKPFFVDISDGTKMSSGITSKVLCPRGGSRPVHHGLTYFNNVHLPSTSLLCSLSTSTVTSSREQFFVSISRVIFGTFAVTGSGIASMRIASHIVAKYSLRRKVQGSPPHIPQRPIISFSTQYIPVLTSIAQTLVMISFAESAYRLFVSSKMRPTFQHFIATIFKATVLRFARETTVVLGDRCGAQGLAEVNQFTPLHNELRGAQIAEGDILGLSIRFSMDLLLGRIEAPPSSNLESLLSKHEASMISDMRAELAQFSSGSRDPAFESRFTPRALPLIEAVGHRMAYEAAVQSGLERSIIDLFIASVVKLDPAWYSETVGLSRRAQIDMEFDSATILYPQLSELTERLEASAYVTAPIVSEDKWQGYVDALPVVGSDLQVCEGLQSKVLFCCNNRSRL
jgi:acyl-CoA oxidase